jgi:hypothetical protein
MLFGPEVVTKGIDEIFESVFNSTEKMRSLLSVCDGDSSSELYWEAMQEIFRQMKRKSLRNF